MFGKENLHKTLKKIGQGGGSALSTGDWILDQDQEGNLIAFNINTVEQVVLARTGKKGNDVQSNIE